VKYSGDHVLLAEGEKELQGMIDRLTEVGIWYGMEINVQNIYGNENLKAAIPSTECDRYTTKNVEYYNYLCSMITNDAWCARGFKFSIASIRQEKGSLHLQTGLTFKEEATKVLYLGHCWLWC
jgi:hypothetical protein